MIVIATAEHLPNLQARAQAPAGALAFRETETLEALAAICQEQPGVVVLERLFAATPRGAALINRIKADPALGGTEIRILGHDSEYARVIAPRQPAAAAVPVPSSPPPSLDYRGTRRAPRFRMRAGVEVLVDGDPVTLVDLSTIGAQVLSPKALRPDQRVRVAIGADREQHRVSASIAWAKFEMPSGRSYYRAGLAFLNPDTGRLDAFCHHFRQSDG